MTEGPGVFTVTAKLFDNSSAGVPFDKIFERMEDGETFCMRTVPVEELMLTMV